MESYGTQYPRGLQADYKYRQERSTTLVMGFTGSGMHWVKVKIGMQNTLIIKSIDFNFIYL